MGQQRERWARTNRRSSDYALQTKFITVEAAPITNINLYPSSILNPYYIYALKDPRSTPAIPFYIGKGTGTRAWDHTLNVDKTRKGERIASITASGHDVITTVLANDLTEHQALKLEAELISAFGTESTGGTLTNSVIPVGSNNKIRNGVVIPSGSVEKAQIGLELIKSAILELARANPEGILNSDAAKALGLQSDYLGGSKDYLSWSVLGLLMREGKMVRVESKKHKATTK